MALLKKLDKELKIFFYLIAVKSLLIGMPLGKFRDTIKNLKKNEDQLKFSTIHSKLTEKKMISAEELEFLIEYERKRQWDKF